MYLAAVCLGIGIVIGGALMGNEEIVKGQEKLILSLEQEFDQLRREEIAGWPKGKCGRIRSFAPV